MYEVTTDQGGRSLILREGAVQTTPVHEFSPSLRGGGHSMYTTAFGLAPSALKKEQCWVVKYYGGVSLFGSGHVFGTLTGGGSKIALLGIWKLVSMRRRRNFFWGGGFALNEAMCDLKQIANWSPQATTKVEKKPLKILKTEKLGGIVFFTFILVDILFSKRIQIEYTWKYAKAL